MPRRKGQIKARLRVQLWADDALVAESEDPSLWSRVLARIRAEPAAAAGPEGAAGKEGDRAEPE